jgi:hypothetical protein
MNLDQLKEMIANSDLSEEDLLRLIENKKTKILPQEVTPVDELSQLSELLKSDKWPQAVDPSLICNPDSEEDKLDRAEGIIDLLIDEPLKEKKFLDFGCGEGHVVSKTSQQTLSIGYDIKSHPKWEEFKNEKAIFSTDIEYVKSKAPYDIILIYDVLDHSQDDVLAIASSLFSSRHATHIYHKLNKAYLHLVFSEDELEILDLINPEYNRKIVFPIVTYEASIKANKLKIVNSNILRQKVEPFFKQNDLIAKRIAEKIKASDKFPEFQCEQQFLDYILVKG